MATLMKVGEKPKHVEPKNGNDFKLEELWELIGGYVQIVRLRNNEIMIVDEDGLPKGLPINGEACRYVEAHCDYGHLIVGTALICESREVE